MIVGLFTELLTPGGVQRVGLCAAAILARYARQHGRDHFLISLNDPEGDHELSLGGESFVVHGMARKKFEYVKAIWKATPRITLAYMAHPNLAPIGMLMRLRSGSMPYIVASHGVDVWETMTWQRRLALARSTMVTAPSQFTADKMIQAQRLDRGKVVVVPWGFDVAEFDARTHGERINVPLPQGKILLTIARLAVSERFKGVDMVIEAMTEVIRRVPDARYVIVGDGDDRPRIEESVRSRGLSSHVIFRGIRPDRELPAYYQGCDVFVMPSSKEGFGLVHVEAMSFAKPVIGSIDSATPEVVLDGQTGFLVKPGDVGALADRLIQLLENPELRSRLGAAGRNRVLENYTFTHFSRRFEEVLKSCEGR